jgi:hypothetical protein
MMRGGVACLSLVGTLAVCAPAATAAQSVTYPVSSTTPFAWATDNPCTGEPVTLTGTYHLESNFRVDTDTSGVSFHSQELRKYTLSGTSLTGARYQNEQELMTEENGTFTFDAAGLAPYETTAETTMLLIRQGDVPRQDDFYVRISAHTTYNANGVITVGGISVDVFCR